jgi:hypothetical protein
MIDVQGRLLVPTGAQHHEDPMQNYWQPPWPPIRVSDCEWIVLRNLWVQPSAIIRRIDGPQPHYRVVTWAPTSAERRLVGRYLTLEAADRAVLFDVSTTGGPGRAPDEMWSTHSKSAEGMNGR